MKIVAKKQLGKRHVYDLEVKEHHNFIANNVVVHNCTSRGAQKLFKAGKPTSIIDIAILTSIYRPGPLAADVDKFYLKAKEGEKFDWGHPLFEKVLGQTYNLLIFQESVMDLAEHIGGFPKDQCDNVRRAIMKRDLTKSNSAQKEAKRLEDDFVKGAIQKGIPEITAKKAYQQVLWYAGYGFNKCCTIDSKVNTYVFNDGVPNINVKLMKDVKSGDIVMSRDELTKKDIFVTVKKLHMNGKRKIVKIKLNSGETIKCTMDHKFRTIETNEMLPLYEIIAKNLSIVVNSSVTTATSAIK